MEKQITIFHKTFKRRCEEKFNSRVFFCFNMGGKIGEQTMSETKPKTVAEWDALEKTKRSQLEEISSKKMLADAQRADLLLLIGELPNDKTLKKDLETIEQMCKDLALELEATEALLKAIPERRKFARAREIVAEVEDIQQNEARLQGHLEEIDAAADAFAVVVKRYADFLLSLHKADSLAFPLPDYGNGIRDALGAALAKQDESMRKNCNIGIFRGALAMVNQSNPTKKQFKSRVTKMKEVALYLRGEIKAKEVKNICPACFGVVVEEVIKTTWKGENGQPRGRLELHRKCNRCGFHEWRELPEKRAWPVMPGGNETV